MKQRILFGFLAVQIWLVGAVCAQKMVVINDPTVKSDPVSARTVSEDLVKREVLPKARKYWAANDSCTEEFEVMGEARGAFSKPNSNQKLVFYQFCQTGNGFGNNGLVLLENDKIIGSYVSEGGWAMDLESLPDINQNGLNEFLVYYSGGMHQGQSGTGVDLLEFSASGVKGLGWFQSDSFGEESGDWAYKVSVKTGKTPVFYREKYISAPNDKWKKSGKLATFKLDAAVAEFKVLK